MEHEIFLMDPTPVYRKQFKISEGHVEAVQNQVKEWLKLNIVQPSISRFNSPIFVVKKKDGSFRLVQDFRAWQMVLKPQCQEYTAFMVYGIGQYEFQTSPMGLLGCPGSFQKLMELVMKNIPNVQVYIDDILIHSKTHEELRKILTEVLRQLKKHNLKIRLEK